MYQTHPSSLIYLEEDDLSLFTFLFACTYIVWICIGWRIRKFLLAQLNCTKYFVGTLSVQATLVQELRKNALSPKITLMGPLGVSSYHLIRMWMECLIPKYDTAPPPQCWLSIFALSNISTRILSSLPPPSWTVYGHQCHPIVRPLRVPSAMVIALCDLVQCPGELFSQCSSYSIC